MSAYERNSLAHDITVLPVSVRRLRFSRAGMREAWRR